MGCAASKHADTATDAAAAPAPTPSPPAALEVHAGDTLGWAQHAQAPAQTPAQAHSAGHPDGPHLHTGDALSPLFTHSSPHSMIMAHTSLDLDSVDVNFVGDGKMGTLLESYAMLKEGESQWNPRYVQLKSGSIDVYGSKSNCHEKRLLLRTVNFSFDLCDRVAIANTVLSMKVRPSRDGGRAQPRNADARVTVELQFADHKRALAWYKAVIATSQD